MAGYAGEYASFDLFFVTDIHGIILFWEGWWAKQRRNPSVRNPKVCKDETAWRGLETFSNQIEFQIEFKIIKFVQSDTVSGSR